MSKPGLVCGWALKDLLQRTIVHRLHARVHACHCWLCHYPGSMVHFCCCSIAPHFMWGIQVVVVNEQVHDLHAF